MLREYWPIALVLTGSRLAVTFGLGKLSSHVVKDAPSVKTWGWTPLISQAGVAIGLATTIARTFPSFGAEFGAIALACIALNELVGPILFKFALDRTGESKAPLPSLIEDVVPPS